MPEPRTGVLFICMGNICRSPLAEGVFAHLAARRGVRDRFDIDSCGTGGWHAGEPSDPRAVATALRNGIRLDRVARALDPARDFARFHHLIAMDRANERHVLGQGAPRDRVRLLRSFGPAGREIDVPDPYYGGDEGFDEVFRIAQESCAGLLDHLLPDDRQAIRPG